MQAPGRRHEWAILRECLKAIREERNREIEDPSLNVTGPSSRVARGLIGVTVLVLLGVDGVRAEVPNRAAIELSAGMAAEAAIGQIESFKSAVRARSCFGVAAQTRFPLRVNRTDARVLYISNRTALCRYFPALFDDARTRLVLDQKPEDMPVGYRGLTFGPGTFWLAPICRDPALDDNCPAGQYELRLTTVNLGHAGLAT